MYLPEEQKEKLLDDIISLVKDYDGCQLTDEFRHRLRELIEDHDEWEKQR